MSQITGISSEEGDVADKLTAMLETFHPQLTPKSIHKARNANGQLAQ